MICKEELCALFKNLSPYKRIDYMCSLLHMCHPLEVRFIGSVLEEYGRENYYYLRDAEIKANTPHEVSRLTELGETAIFAGLNVYLCLLHSSNFPCSKLIFEILDTCLRRAFDFSKPSNPKEHEELLLALSLAVHHPAFSFYQKTILCKYYTKWESQIRDLDKPEKPDVDNSSLPEESSRKEPLATNKVVISNIDIRDIKKRSERKTEFKIQVSWSNNEQFEINKTPRELLDFQIKLQKLFPNEVDGHMRGWKIPYLHGNTYHTCRDERENPMFTLQQYFCHIIELPQHVLESDLVTQFFRAGHSVKISHPRLESPPEPVIGTYPLKSMIVSNSQFSDLAPDDSGGTNPKCGSGQRTCVSTKRESHHVSNRQEQSRHVCSTHGLASSSTTTQHRSPAYSPLSSSTDSPSSSRPGSPASHVASVASVTQLLTLLNLDKYSSTLSKYTVEQLASLTPEELSAEGLPLDCQQLLQSKLENITRNKSFGSKNGIVELCQPGRVLSPSSANMMWHTIPPNLPYPQLASPVMPCQMVYITSPSVSSPGSEMGGPGMVPGSGPLSDLANQDVSSECSSTPPSPSQCTAKQRGNVDSSASDDSEKEKCDNDDKACRRKDLPPGQSGLSPGVMRPDDLKVTPPVQSAVFVEAKPEFSPLMPAQNGYQSDSPHTPVMSTGYPPARPTYIAMRPYKVPQPTHAHMGLPMKNVVTMPQDGGPMKPNPQAMPPHLIYPVQQVRSEYPTNIVPVSVNNNNNTAKNSAEGLHKSQTFMMGRPLKGSAGGSSLSWSGSCSANSNTTTSTCTVQSAYHSRQSPGPAPLSANPNGGGVMLPAPSASPPEAGLQAVPGMAAGSPSVSTAPSMTTRSVTSQSPSPPTQTLNSSSSVACDTACGSCDCHSTYPPTTAYPQYSTVPPAAFWPLQIPPHLLAQGNGLIAHMPPNMYGQIPAASYPNGINPEYLFQHHPNFKYLPPGVLPMSYMYGCTMSHNSASKHRNQGCYNCGGMNHKVQDCKEKSMESLSGFHLNYKPKSDSD